MRLIRNTGETITPSDDGRLIKTALGDGLFGSVTFTVSSGAINLPAFKGVLSGRDFSVDAMTMSPTLPATETTVTGSIVARIDLTSETPLSIISVLNPYTLTTDDLNEGGVVCEMLLATYRANVNGVSSVTMNYTQVEGTSDTGWITFNTAIVYRVKNGVVYMRVRQAGGTQRAHGYVFGTLPADVSPRYSIAEANVYGIGRIFINQNHTVTIEYSDTTTKTDYIQASFTYPLG